MRSFLIFIYLINYLIISFFPFCNGFGLMHRAVLVFGRGVDGVELHGVVADVGNIVPGAGGDKNGIVFKHGLADVEPFPALAHLHQTLAAFQAQELVGVGMALQSNVLTGLDAHYRDLQIWPRP